MIDPNSTFSGIPDSLRTELLKTYNNIASNYRARRWEPAELNGGKLCEVVYTILKGAADGKFPARPQKPKNFLRACRDLESAGRYVCRSMRIQIPRLLIALYEIRNNRNVGHTGGDVDPNEMDAAFVLQSAKWIMAELVRVFHNIGLSDATKVVEALTERNVPLIWNAGKNRRVLNTDLSHRDQTLILLEPCEQPVKCETLLKWTEYKNRSRYKKLVLNRLHKERLIEFDARADTVMLSPLGVRYVEEKIVARF